MTEISYLGKRIRAGILLLIGLFSLANYYFEWGIFGRFDKAVMIGIYFSRSFIWCALGRRSRTCSPIEM